MSQLIGLILGYACLGISCILILISACKKTENQSSYIIWHFISWLYMYKWYPSIDSSISPTLESISKGLHEAFHPISIIPLSEVNSLSENFKKLGLDNPYFLNNGEIVLMIWTGSLIIYLTVLICTCSKSLKKTVCDNLIIRSSLILFTEISVVSFIQISEFEISTWYGVMNSILSVAIICCLVFLMIFLTFIIFFRLKSGNEESIARIITVVEEFKNNSYKQMLYYTFFMVERFLSAAALAMFTKYPGIQVFVLIFLLFCKFLYTLFVLPFRFALKNLYIAGLDFLSVISISLIIICSEDIGDTFKNAIAWSYFAIVVLAMAGCLFLFFKPDLGEKSVYGTKVAENKEENVNHTHVESSIDLKNQTTMIETRPANRRDSVISMKRRQSIKTVNDSDDVKIPDTHIESTERKGNRNEAISSYTNKRASDRKVEPEDNRHDSYPDRGSRIPYYGPLFRKYATREGLN